MEVNFLLLRSYGRENALARIQSDPLFEGLAQLDPLTVKCIYTARENIEIPRPRYVVVHYNDHPSLFHAKKIKALIGCKIICLAADIYNLDQYIALSEIADIFLVPTELHQEILQSAVWKPVFVLPEGLDAIAMPAPGQPALPVAQNKSLCWFGYPESFTKSMKYILQPALEKSGFPLDNFALITAPDTHLMDEAQHLKFSEEEFYGQTSRYGYSLLSHFTFDCSINSYIKSPNKLLTCLVRGMIPLISNTPNYRKIADEYHLHPLVYSHGPGLVELLGNLDCARDRNARRLDAIAEDLKSRFSPKKIAGIFLNLC